MLKQKMIAKLIIWSCIFGLCCSIRIVERPYTVQVVEGKNAILKCVVEGISNDAVNPVQWTKGNFALGTDRNLTKWKRYFMVGDEQKGEYNLLIKQAELKDDDNYECQVSTTGFQAKSNASVIILVAPVGPFIKDLTEVDGETQVDVIVGKENKLICEAFNGKPAAKIKWYKDNNEIVEGVEQKNNVIMKLENSSSILRLTPSDEDEQSTYSCGISHVALNTSQHKLFSLNLLRPPVVSVHIPEFVYEEDNFFAECRTYAKPRPQSYRWFINDVILPSESLPKCMFGPVNKTWNQAKIACEAQNIAGKSEKSKKTLEVFYTPLLDRHTDKIEADIGQNITLECVWDSNPPPLISWTRKGSTTILSDSSQLHLNLVTQADSGIYICSVVAAKFTNSSSAQLHVKGPPIFNHESIQYATLGKDAFVSCSLSSHPGIRDVIWIWGHEQLDGNGTIVVDDQVKYKGMFDPTSPIAKLQIANVAEEDLHEYTCKVGNSYGEKSSKISLVEDLERAEIAMTISVAIGVGVGVFSLIVIAMLITYCCIRSKRKSKSTNLDRECHKSHKNSKKFMSDQIHSRDETEKNHDPNSGVYNVTSSVSSHEAPASSVSGQDENPTPPSGADDGYHTEEASSWNRNYSEKTNFDNGTNSGKLDNYKIAYVDLPPINESSQPLLSDQFPTERFQNFSRPMSANRQPNDISGSKNSIQAVRSASALGERFSPSISLMQERQYSDTAPSRNLFIAPTANLYPATATYIPLQSIIEPNSHYGNVPPYSDRHRMTPVPSAIADYDGVLHPFVTSQSSLDRFERESALSASRHPEQYDLNGRNLHSRMSQSSKSSEFSRPLVARMATHV